MSSALRLSAMVDAARPCLCELTPAAHHERIGLSGVWTTDAHVPARLLDAEQHFVRNARDKQARAPARR